MSLTSQLWPGVSPYTFQQLEGFWIEAGGTQAMAPLMAAIGMAEQGANQLGDWVAGQPTSLGPWQIHDANWGWLGVSSNPGVLMNPITNAQAAIAVLKSQGLGAWSTYNNGAYKQYLNGSQSSIVTGGPVSIGSLVPAGSSGAPLAPTSQGLQQVLVLGAVLAVAIALVVSL